MAIDPRANLWVGTQAGLAKFDGASWEVHDTSNSGLPSDYVTRLVVDAQGKLWIAIAAQSLVAFDGERWEVYDEDNAGLPRNSILSLAVDAHGSLWLGAFAGLAKFDGEFWEVFDTSNSALPNNLVLSLASDGQGNLWIATLPGTTTVVLDKRDESAVPGMFSLEQNYPNPFNSDTVIRFALARSGPVELALEISPFGGWLGA
jgi:ligand-binding sensor domain-containing protein